MADFTIKKKALNVDMQIEVGATFDPVLTYSDADGNPIDNSGWTALLEFRDSEDNSVLDTLSETDGIILGGADGNITFDITKDDNIAYTWPNNAIYDLFLNDGTKDYRIIFGNASLIDRVTEVP